MYNKELKTKFVREYTKNINVSNLCMSIFNDFEKYEQEWNADLCTRTVTELQPAVDNAFGLRGTSKRRALIVLKEYVKWCTKTNVPGACNGMLEINSVGFDKLKTQTVSSPLHLQNYLNSVFESEDEKTVDNIYRCYCWLVYGGIPDRDALKITSDDVDLTNMIVHYGEIEVPIYREALKSFKNCIELSQFVYKHPLYNNIIYRDRAPGDILIRGIKANISLQSMRVELSRKIKKAIDQGKTTIKLSHFRIWISGVFYRMYERERAGVPADFSKIAEQFMEGKEYKLDSGRNTKDAVRRKKAKEYLEDYERWKTAF